MVKLNPSKYLLVIGNSPSVLNYNLGMVIDLFGDIVRFNNYITEGYEKYIGSKTTIWARSNSKATKDRKNLDQFKRIIICSPAWNMKATIPLSKRFPKSEVVPLRMVTDLERQMGLSGTRVNKGNRVGGWPSSGLILLYYLLTSHKPIYIHGFDYFMPVDGKPRHYYNNKEEIKAKSHNSKEEKKWIENQIRKGRLRWLVEDASNMINLKDLVI